MIIFFTTAELNIAQSHSIADDINYQLNCSVYVATGIHAMPHFHIHLIAFDRQEYRKIKLIAVTLMTSSKTRAPELKMITRDFY